MLLKCGMTQLVQAQPLSRKATDSSGNRNALWCPGGIWWLEWLRGSAWFFTQIMLVGIKGWTQSLPQMKYKWEVFCSVNRIAFFSFIKQLFSPQISIKWFNTKFLFPGFLLWIACCQTASPKPKDIHLIMIYCREKQQILTFYKL